MTEQELVDGIDNLLNVPFDGDFTRVDGQMRWKIDLASRETLREQILALLNQKCCLIITEALPELAKGAGYKSPEEVAELEGRVRET